MYYVNNKDNFQCYQIQFISQLKRRPVTAAATAR
jgi:hypothetical protein